MSTVVQNTAFDALYANPFASQKQKPSLKLAAQPTQTSPAQQTSSAQQKLLASNSENAAVSNPQVDTTKQQAFDRILQNYTRPSFGQKPTKFAHLIEDMDQKMQHYSAQENHIAQNTTSSAAADGDYSFFDVIDIINPLQHIPVISSIYRAITGDTIRQETRVAGNVLLGALTGPVGMALSVGSSSVDMMTDKPLGDHVLAAVAPNLQETIREEYSIASFFDNPFGTPPSEQLAGKQEVVHAPIRATKNFQNAQEASQVYAQTAAVLGQKIHKEAPVASGEKLAAQAQKFSTLPVTVSDFTGQENTHQENIVAQPIPNLLDAPTKLNAPAKLDIPKILDKPAKEAQALAKSVVHNPNTVVQISPDAAAQLANLAAGTASSAELNAQLLGMNGDGASQLRAITAKNRELGLALDSSASISQQISNVEQRQISLDIGNKVAALYDQNYTETLKNIENNRKSAARNLVNQQQLPSFDREISHDQQSALDAAQPKDTSTGITPVQVREQLAQNPRLTPNQLGQNYHNANVVGNLSIAAAMQQALEKYQTLRRN